MFHTCTCPKPIALSPACARTTGSKGGSDTKYGATTRVSSDARTQPSSFVRLRPRRVIFIFPYRFFTNKRSATKQRPQNIFQSSCTIQRPYAINCLTLVLYTRIMYTFSYIYTCGSINICVYTTRLLTLCVPADASCDHAFPLT